MTSSLLSRVMRVRFALVLGCCLAVFCALPLSVGTAHALFATEVHGATSHGVKAFPTGLSVESGGGEQRSMEIDRGRLTVNVIYSDGSSRTLMGDEYELVPAEVPAGFKGDFESRAVYREGGHEVSSTLALDVSGAYGAQYEDVLVFGRGMPPATYQDKALTNTTWGIEEESCAPNWDKTVLTSVVDIDTVAPVSIAGWFNYTAGIQTIELEQMDASHLTTMEGAFRNNTALTSIDITDWDTSNVKSLNSCFRSCTELLKIEGLGDLDTSQVTDLTWTFGTDYSLQEADVARWDISNVTSLERTFNTCYSLTSVDLSSWDTSSCTTMDCMFYMYPTSRSSLRSVGDLSNWDVSRVKNMGSMFAYNDELASPGNLSRWNTSSLTMPVCLFQYCHGLTTIGDIGNWNVSRCTDFTNMFQHCDSLKSLGDLSRWNTANVTNMFQMFQFDANLTVDCRSWNVSKVTQHENFNGNGASSVKAPAWKS